MHSELKRLAGSLLFSLFTASLPLSLNSAHAQSNGCASCDQIAGVFIQAQNECMARFYSQGLSFAVADQEDCANKVGTGGCDGTVAYPLKDGMGEYQPKVIALSCSNPVSSFLMSTVAWQEYQQSIGHPIASNAQLQEEKRELHLQKKMAQD